MLFDGQKFVSVYIALVSSRVPKSLTIILLQALGILIQRRLLYRDGQRQPARIVITVLVPSSAMFMLGLQPA
jgi:hypothetical protein